MINEMNNTKNISSIRTKNRTDIVANNIENYKMKVKYTPVYAENPNTPTRYYWVDYGKIEKKIIKFNKFGGK
jgi:hypothetical protein